MVADWEQRGRSQFEFLTSEHTGESRGEHMP